MLVDKLSQDLNRRSSSAWAKKALASRKISLALRSSRTSRSSAFTRSRSALVRHRACQRRSRVYGPNHARSAEHNRSWAQWIQRLPTRTDTRHGVRTPCVPHAHVLRGKTCLTFSWLHSLRCWEPPQNPRGGSIISNLVICSVFPFK